MSGKIIEFCRHGGVGRGKLAAGKPLPHGGSRQSRLEQQVARISALLEELEGIDLGSPDLPLSVIAQAQADIRNARDILRSAPRPHYVQGEGDPQPCIDREVLERMYRSLDTLR